MPSKNGLIYLHTKVWNTPNRSPFCGLFFKRPPEIGQYILLYLNLKHPSRIDFYGEHFPKCLEMSQYSWIFKPEIPTQKWLLGNTSQNVPLHRQIYLHTKIWNVPEVTFLTPPKIGQFTFLLKSDTPILEVTSMGNKLFQRMLPTNGPIYLHN